MTVRENTATGAIFANATGLTDDNVHFQNTMQLTLALLKAGKPYELLLLPGTHMLADDLIRARETERQMDFFAEHLGAAR